MDGETAGQMSEAPAEFLPGRRSSVRHREPAQQARYGGAFFSSFWASKRSAAGGAATPWSWS